MWLEYERWKRLLNVLNLSPEEYEQKIQEKIKELENVTNEHISSINR